MQVFGSPPMFGKNRESSKPTRPRLQDQSTRLIISALYELKQQKDIPGIGYSPI